MDQHITFCIVTYPRHPTDPENMKRISMFASKNHWDFRKISSELWYADELKTLERYLPIKIVKIEDVESKFIHDLSCKTGYPYIRDRKQLGVKVPKKV